VQKDYYTLDCILFLLKNVSLAHAMYVRQAAVCLPGVVVLLLLLLLIIVNDCNYDDVKLKDC